MKIMRMKTILVRKAIDLENLKKDTETLKKIFKEKPEEVKVKKIVELRKEEYQNFISYLLDDRDYLAEDTELYIRTEKDATALLVKQKGTENKDGIIVVTEGFTYARYTGIPIIE